MHNLGGSSDVSTTTSPDPCNKGSAGNVVSAFSPPAMVTVPVRHAGVAEMSTDSRC